MPFPLFVEGSTGSIWERGRQETLNGTWVGAWIHRTLFKLVIRAFGIKGAFNDSSILLKHFMLNNIQLARLE